MKKYFSLQVRSDKCISATIFYVGFHSYRLFENPLTTELKLRKQSFNVGESQLRRHNFEFYSSQDQPRFNQT
jgi:hypothetical protein